MTQCWDIPKDFAVAARKVIRLTSYRLLTSWIYTPLGILCTLLACWGVNRLIALGSISFPASVALLISLFVALSVCEIGLGEKATRRIVHIVDFPLGFALRFINIFFTPSFVLLPLSPHVSGIEVAKIVGVFVFGFVVMFSTTAYLIRGLQLLVGVSKKGATGRAEELGAGYDDIPLNDASRTRSRASAAISWGGISVELLPNDTGNVISAPSPSQDPSRTRNTVGYSTDLGNETSYTGRAPRQDPPPPTRAEIWTAFMTANLDTSIYAALFVFIGLPIYFIAGYAMPIHLSLNVLAYFTALALPLRYKRFLHPVLVSSAITVLGIWVLALCRGKDLRHGLNSYSTRTTYIQMFHGTKGLPRPGAGDVFASVLDVSIVALALPMFQYRSELKRHFAAIFVPNVVIAVASLFAYPALCVTIGISPARSLSFASRSLTLALATPATANLGGDLSLVAVLCIMSGILGVLIGPQMLVWLRIPEDDYVTRGVTFGGNSSAIATALLLASDPRAAALSSLSMSLFGTVLVALTSIPPVVRAVLALVGSEVQ